MLGHLFACFRYCGVKNPSWTELHHFIKFLNTQLEDCEGSIFCNEAVVGDVLQGFKQFVVQFMIRMSRVCFYINAMADRFIDTCIGLCYTFTEGCSIAC